jgi:HK97 gp10 family phage protein
LKRTLRRLPKAVRAEIPKGLEAAGKLVTAEIKARAPKRSGRMAMAAQYSVSRDKMSVRIGYTRFRNPFKRWWYRGGFAALYQEFGTKNMPAKPFIKPAFRAKLPRALTMIENSVSRALDRARKGQF